MKYLLTNMRSAVLAATLPLLCSVACQKADKAETLRSELLSTTSTTTAYNVENSLPAGYVTDGSVDYTHYVQSALNTYSDLEFPAFPILVNDTGLKVKSNQTITFLPGSELWMAPSSRNTYGVIRFDAVSNVTLNAPVIKGDRYTHLVTTGEWGMGILMYSSSDITINDAQIRDCWGDGLYMGRSNANPNQRVTINNLYCTNNRRNGVSVIAADSLIMNSPVVTNTNGASPQSGIDFEPNTSADEMKRIHVNNPVTISNVGYGIAFGIDALLKPTATKTVSAVITNHKDTASGKFSMVVSCYRRDSTTTGTVTGTIEMVNPDWKNPATNRAFQFWVTESTFTGSISTPKVMISGVYKTQAQMQTLFPFWTNAGTLTVTY
ncbi:right-handed parallel beta-helix repeat-containing protein [Chitinophaga lutea]